MNEKQETPKDEQGHSKKYLVQALRKKSPDLIITPKSQLDQMSEQCKKPS